MRTTNQVNHPKHEASAPEICKPRPHTAATGKTFLGASTQQEAYPDWKCQATINEG